MVCVGGDTLEGCRNGHWGDVAAVIIRNHYAPLLEGRDCLAHEFLNDLMWRYSQRFGESGFASVARSAIDQALWDLKGKLLSKPVYTLLGGPCRQEVELYATTDDLDWAMELGFRAFKISNPAHYSDGLEGLNRLEEKVANAREIVGPDAELMLNPNMSYNIQFAIQVMERLAPYRLRWLEEPLPPYDLEGYPNSSAPSRRCRSRRAKIITEGMPSANSSSVVASIFYSRTCAGAAG
nr:enolase C-terminal domain-like protein [Chelativorans sp. J32]